MVISTTFERKFYFTGSKFFLSEWKKAGNAVREECCRLASAGASGLHRKRLTGARRKAIYQQLEVAVLAWSDSQLENGLKTHPTEFWDQVCAYAVTREEISPWSHCFLTAPHL